MTENPFIKRVSCPFGEECPQSSICRLGVAKIVADRRIILSNDLKRELKEGDLGYGDTAAGKALKFLHHVEKDKEGRKKDIFGCRRHIEALCTVKERRRTDKSNVIRFNGPNKLFFVKPKPRRFWSEVRKLLTEIQRWLLESSESGFFGSYYLSSFETRKLAPFPADYVSDSLDKLLDLGFLQEVTAC